MRRCKVLLANAVLRTSGLLLRLSVRLDSLSRRVYRSGYELSVWAFRDAMAQEEAEPAIGRRTRVLLENQTELELDFEVRFVDEPDGMETVIVGILAGREVPS